jgi:hypothetical protein
MAEEIDDLGGVEGAGVEPEVPPGDAGGGRKHLPFEAALQYRGLPVRGSDPCPVRSFARIRSRRRRRWCTSRRALF